MKNKNKFEQTNINDVNEIDEMDEMDVLLYELAKKDYTPIPEEIHNNFMNTLHRLELERQNAIANQTTTGKSNDIKNKFINAKSKKRNHIPFKERFGTIITSPAKTLGIVCLATVLITTGIVGARNISEKYFNKNHVRLDNIGIANEFIFTQEVEDALKQNVPLNLVELDDNYYINIQSVLLDEVNFFTTFELHSKSGVTDDLEFHIRDLNISDEKGNTIFSSNLETSTNMNSGYNHIYNTNNSIKQLFFMFGNDSSAIQELNYSFSNIEIYKYDKELNKDKNLADIDLQFEKQTITVPITKENYNTIQEYVLENEMPINDFNIRNVIYTKTGLYILAECGLDSLNPIIKSDHNISIATYKLPLKRTDSNNILTLYLYNIKNIDTNIIELYNDINKEKYNLIPKN